LNDFISEIDQHPISIDDITTAEVLANTNTTSICQLECFMTELDKLLQTKSLYEDNQIDKHKIEILEMLKEFIDELIRNQI